MKVLLSWLREFAPFEGDPVALGDQMSDLGMAVESIERLGERPRRHRRGPRCSTCGRTPTPTRSSWSTSTAATARRCRSAAAPSTWPSATSCRWPRSAPSMPGGMKIERRKLRGQWSNGMLCSAASSGLGDDHDGILILSPGTRRRARRSPTALGIVPDVLYDLEINPNRPDAMSVAGVARDLAARLQRAVHASCRPSVAEPARRSPAGVSVEIVDADLCGRFLRAGARRRRASGRRPTWLANRLTHARHAPDQQRRRRLQLRDARAGPAQPHLRPRQGRRAARCGCAGPARARPSAPSTTSSAP